MIHAKTIIEGYIGISPAKKRQRDADERRRIIFEILTVYYRFTEKLTEN
jgi:hypothetical protein